MTILYCARPILMRLLVGYCFLVFALVAAAPAQQLPPEDVVRIREFYRLAGQIQDQIWPDWSTTSAPLLLVTADAEFLTHHSALPAGFKPAGEGVSVRPRQFDRHLLATFPAFGPPSVIVIGEPQDTEAKTSTPWLIIAMHEHFHQLQNGQPGYFDAVADLGLSRGDRTGMWMLNYPFPYDEPNVARGFAQLRDLLLEALNTADEEQFGSKAAAYVKERQRVFARLSPDDHKYLSFQLWQEGIARYTQIKVAEAAANYEPTAAFAALPDYEPFLLYAKKARAETLDELRRADMAKMHRLFVYSFGAAEGLLLDRLNPDWKKGYFRRMLSTDALFGNGGK